MVVTQCSLNMEHRSIREGFNISASLFPPCVCHSERGALEFPKLRPCQPFEPPLSRIRNRHTATYPMSNLQQELPDLGFLADVSSEHRSFLASYGRFLRPQPGEVLIAAGEPQESLYVILSGSVHITSEVSGRPMLLASLSGGDSIGEINLFDPATASATAVCRTAGLVWALSHRELDSFVTADPEAGVAVLRGLLALMARRIRGMNDKLATAEQRATMHNFWSESKA